MLEFQERKKVRQILYSRPFLLLLSIILAFAANAAYHMYLNVRDTGVNRAEALREEGNLNAKAGELEKEISKMKTDRGMEEEIRKKYRVVKEGESVMIVVDDKANTAAAAEAPSGFQSLYDRIKNWLKK